MNHTPSSHRLAEAMSRAVHHWESLHLAEPAEKVAGRTTPAVTLAVSREAGANGALIARAVADRLGWPLYDKELLQRIASEMGVHAHVLSRVDEKRKSWLTEAFESFASAPTLSASAYLRRLGETVFSLAEHGECVIVGRGAAQILPASTTLRVRMVAPLEARICTVRQREHLNREEAARRVTEIERERAHFVKDHFQKDVGDAHEYDLVLNTARFSVEGCAEVILEAVKRFQARVCAASPEPVACGAGIV